VKVFLPFIVKLYRGITNIYNGASYIGGEKEKGKED